MALEPLGTDEGGRGETPENPGITVLLNKIQRANHSATHISRMVSALNFIQHVSSRMVSSLNFIQ